jgi:hypothetical protein
LCDFIKDSPDCDADVKKTCKCVGRSWGKRGGGGERERERKRETVMKETKRKKERGGREREKQRLQN